ncbi:MAG: hypothetical protein V4539_13225 [Bacteroidota bacterium]
MKTIKILSINLLLLSCVAIVSTGCKKVLGLQLQENYNYQQRTLNPNLNMTAKEFLLSRADGSTGAPTDTVFRWMKKGLDYCGMDMSEYEKTGRTYFFLHNDAIRIYNTSTKAVTGGLFFTFPIVNVDASGNPIIDATTGLPKTHPALEWTEYSKATVKNYFLYLIGQGTFNFYDLNAENKTVVSLLPPGTKAGKESMLGYWNGGNGFDQESKFYLRIQNNADIAPIVHNDRSNDRTGGYVTTNGVVHVYAQVIYPSK